MAFEDTDAPFETSPSSGIDLIRLSPPTSVEVDIRRRAACHLDISRFSGTTKHECIVEIRLNVIPYAMPIVPPPA